MDILNFFASLPLEYRPVLITSTTAILGAFIGAIVAQYLSHRLTLKRERSKQISEIYYKLFSPIVFEIYSYIDISTHFRRGHDINLDVNEIEIYIKIFNHVESNLMYASPRLKKAFHTVKKTKYSFDGSGFMSRIDELLLLLTLLEELHFLEKSLKIYDEENINDLLSNKSYLLIWALVLYIYSDDAEALEVIKYKWVFDETKLNEKNYKEMKQKYGFQILTNEGYRKKKFSGKQFIDYLCEELITKSDLREMFKEIINTNIEVFE